MYSVLIREIKKACSLLCLHMFLFTTFCLKNINQHQAIMNQLNFKLTYFLNFLKILWTKKVLYLKNSKGSIGQWKISSGILYLHYCISCIYVVHVYLNHWQTETMEPSDFLTYLLSVPDIKLDSLMKAMQSMDPLKSKIWKLEYVTLKGLLSR